MNIYDEINHFFMSMHMMHLGQIGYKWQRTVNVE